MKSVVEITKMSNTEVWFTLGNDGGVLFVKDGSAYVETATGSRQVVCEADASCSAFQITDAAQAEAYEAAACEALGTNCPTAQDGRRRLKDHDSSCTAASRRERRQLKEEHGAARSVRKNGRRLQAANGFAVNATLWCPDRGNWPDETGFTITCDNVILITGSCGQNTPWNSTTLHEGQRCDLHLTDTWDDGWDSAYLVIEYETPFGADAVMQRWTSTAYTITTGGTQNYAVQITVPIDSFRSVPVVPEFFVSGIGCAVEEDCIVNTVDQGTYRSSANCIVSFQDATELRVEQMDVESGFDFVNLTDGPDDASSLLHTSDNGGLVVGDVLTIPAGSILTFTSDSSVQLSGFRICKSTGTGAATGAASNAAGNPASNPAMMSSGGMASMSGGVPSPPPASPTPSPPPPVWSPYTGSRSEVTVSGDGCQFVEYMSSFCIVHAGYPGNYLNGASCAVTFNGPMDLEVEMMSLETNWDKVLVHISGKQLNSDLAELVANTELEMEAGDTITFTTDGFITRPGFLICEVAGSDQGSGDQSSGDQSSGYGAVIENPRSPPPSIPPAAPSAYYAPSPPSGLLPPTDYDTQTPTFTVTNNPRSETFCEAFLDSDGKDCVKTTDVAGTSYYKNNAVCNISVTVPSSLELALELEYFNLEAHYDKLTILEGNAFVGASYYGPIDGPDAPGRNSLRFSMAGLMQFTSDSFEGRRGFKMCAGAGGGAGGGGGGRQAWPSPRTAPIPSSAWNQWDYYARDLMPMHPRFEELRNAPAGTTTWLPGETAGGLVCHDDQADGFTNAGTPCNLGMRVFDPDLNQNQGCCQRVCDSGSETQPSGCIPHTSFASVNTTLWNLNSRDATCCYATDQYGSGSREPFGKVPIEHLDRPATKPRPGGQADCVAGYTFWPADNTCYKLLPTEISGQARDYHVKVLF